MANGGLQSPFGKLAAPSALSGVLSGVLQGLMFRKEQSRRREETASREAEAEAARQQRADLQTQQQEFMTGQEERRREQELTDAARRRQEALEDQAALTARRMEELKFGAEASLEQIERRSKLTGEDTPRLDEVEFRIKKTVDAMQQQNQAGSTGFTTDEIVGRFGVETLSAAIGQAVRQNKSTADEEILNHTAFSMANGIYQPVPAHIQTPDQEPLPEFVNEAKTLIPRTNFPMLTGAQANTALNGQIFDDEQQVDVEDLALHFLASNPGDLRGAERQFREAVGVLIIQPRLGQVPTSPAASTAPSQIEKGINLLEQSFQQGTQPVREFVGGEHALTGEGAKKLGMQLSPVGTARRIVTNPLVRTLAPQAVFRRGDKGRVIGEKIGVLPKRPKTAENKKEK